MPDNPTSDRADGCAGNSVIRALYGRWWRCHCNHGRGLNNDCRVSGWLRSRSRHRCRRVVISRRGLIDHHRGWAGIIVITGSRGVVIATLIIGPFPFLLVDDAAKQEACPSPNRGPFSSLAVVLVADNASRNSAQDSTQNRVIIEKLGIGGQGRQRQQSRSDCKPNVHLFL
jgi:hypothetical protein